MSLACCLWILLPGKSHQTLHQVDYVFIPPPGTLRRHEPGFVRLAHSETVIGLECREKPPLLKTDLVILPDLPVMRFWNSEGAAAAFKASQTGHASTSRPSGLWNESKGKEQGECSGIHCLLPAV